MADMTEMNDTPTTVDGVRAVEMRYRAIRETDTDSVVFYQSQMRLNSPSLGVLMPDRYLPVIDCTDQCISVFKLALVQVLQSAAKFTDRDISFKWVSIYMPVRLLRRSDCVKIVSEICARYNTAPDKLCFELPITLLEERNGKCAETIRELRRAGYHTMLTEVGGDSCPMMRLADYNLDYILLDGRVTKMLDVSERADSCVKSMIAFVNELGAEPVAAGVLSDAQTAKLYDFECSFYTGPYAGNFALERFIRRKSAE